MTLKSSEEHFPPSLIGLAAAPSGRTGESQGHKELAPREEAIGLLLEEAIDL